MNAEPAAYQAEERANQRLKRLLLYLILAVAAVIALLAGFFFSAPEVTTGIRRSPLLPALGAHLLTEAGVAGLIAIMLALTFEQLAAEEATRERNALKRDIFYYAYGSSIPEDIRREIDAQILRAPFVRNSMAVHYELEEIALPGDANPSFVHIMITTNYEVENITSLEQEYHIRTGVEKSPYPSLEDAYVGFFELEVAGKLKMSASDLTKEEANGRWRMLPKVVLPVKPREKLNVHIKKHCIGNLHGFKYFTSANHTRHLDISVLNRSNTLHVYAGDFGGSELGTAISHNEQGGFYVWTTDKPLLRNQGFIITWRPKDAGAAAAAPEPAQAPVSEVA